MKATTMGWILSLLLSASISNAGEFLVKYKNMTALNKMASMQTEAMGLEMKDIHRPGRLVMVSIAKKNEAKTIAALYADKNIEYVVSNFKIRAYSAPVDAKALKDQYALTKVNAEAAWKRAGNKGNRSVILAVIDTGVDYTHPNLSPNMIPGFDFKDNDADPMDMTGSANPGHGTHCAGIVGATGLVDGGIQGMSPEVSIMPLRFLGADGSGDLNNAIKAIDFAIEKHVAVISASWGATVPEATAKPLIEAIQRADAAGIIFVTAAANDGKNNDNTGVYPANSGTANMMVVAASNSTDAKPSWSNYGKAKVSLAAPGDAIISTLPGNKYDSLSGTSMATPLVAGLVAFLKAQDATLTGAEIRSLMQVTGAKVQIETACNCRVDALAAVDTLISKSAWVVPAAATIAEKATLQFAMKNSAGAVRFESSNPSVATIDANGLLTGMTKGTVIVKATDAAGKTVQSLDINIGTVASTQPGNPGNPGNPGQPGNPGECPLGSPELCQILCTIIPTAPWCAAP
ncbi:MAG: S8 family serine peptidase [Bdellovibrio sp.]|nr:S8 family serine peptidase [Bdellovibrio sp.]